MAKKNSADIAEIKEDAVSNTKFNKEQILELSEFKYLADVVNAICVKKDYKLNEIRTLIEDYFKKEVK
ncbi:MAG: hypothetical protein ACRDA4_00255 [Filifactoraceae bacterium]